MRNVSRMYTSCCDFDNGIVGVFNGGAWDFSYADLEGLLVVDGFHGGCGG